MEWLTPHKQRAPHKLRWLVEPGRNADQFIHKLKRFIVNLNQLLSNLGRSIGNLDRCIRNVARSARNLDRSVGKCERFLLDSFGLTWINLDWLGFTRTHCSWTHWSHSGSVGLPLTHLDPWDSLVLSWTHLWSTWVWTLISVLGLWSAEVSCGTGHPSKTIHSK